MQVAIFKNKACRVTKEGVVDHYTVKWHFPENKICSCVTFKTAVHNLQVIVLIPLGVLIRKCMHTAANTL